MFIYLLRLRFHAQSNEKAENDTDRSIIQNHIFISLVLQRYLLYLEYFFYNGALIVLTLRRINSMISRYLYAAGLICLANLEGGLFPAVNVFRLIC